MTPTKEFTGTTLTKTVCADCGFNEAPLKELTGYVIEKTCDGCGRFGDNRAVIKIAKEA